LFSYQNINGDYTEEWRLFSFEMMMRCGFQTDNVGVDLFGVWRLGLEVFFILDSRCLIYEFRSIE